MNDDDRPADAVDDRVHSAAEHAAEIYRLAHLELPTLRRVDVASETGVDPARSIRWWRALGFAEVPDDEFAFTEVDVEVVRRLGELVDAGALDDADVLRIARVMSTSFSRLVDAQLDVLDAALGREHGHDGAPRGGVTPISADVLEFMESTIVYVWQRHMLAAIGHRMLMDDTETGQAVAFADLSGFSRFAKKATAEQLAHVIETFEVESFDVVSSRSGRVVKLIGDGVMFVMDDLVEAIEGSVELVARLSAIDGIPPVHCGVAFGPTLSIGGDVFGPTVNLASRLTSVARPGAVATPRKGGEELLDREDLDVRRVRRSYDLKGIGRTSIISVRPLSAEPAEAAASSDPGPDD